ncbi:uncharacterized protein PGTG_11326 [Puccinia graminis f. sp. tritici CRL 75-36-700-3]|uniref:Uncharacterized protein n=1 Tax=Puccinia graminis f. sp. tritici (strain CRL 75-36-700-3 / race SCCL) TaxID=418459 RepID=E3KLI2_PUCGT|nr:uncharacterized protein PGTG_11326 [Puccinia graminis f. sp. tritici CRL 75-36-700-3]EFP85157.1 hypothetical protein PGTG_11326 [Puccinia graminis f. sp. tritici CRL 75-36-700-3]
MPVGVRVKNDRYDIRGCLSDCQVWVISLIGDLKGLFKRGVHDNKFTKPLPGQPSVLHSLLENPTDLQAQGHCVAGVVRQAVGTGTTLSWTEYLAYNLHWVKESAKVRYTQWQN